MPRLSAALCLLLLPGLLARGESPPALADRYGDPLPHGAVARLGTVRWRQAGLLAVAFSPDGKTLAVGGYDQSVHLIEAAIGREVRVLGGPESWVRGVAFISEGRVVVASSEDHTVRWWDAATGKELRRLEQRGELQGLAATPDGKTLAWGDGRVVRLVDAATGKTLRSLTGHEKAVTTLAFDGRGRLLATASVQEKLIRLWDTATGKEVRRIDAEEHCPVALSPDGKLLAICELGYRVCLIDTTTGTEVFHLLGHSDGVGALAFSPDGKRLASSDDTVRVWDLATRRQLLCLSGRHLSITALAWSPNGRLLASTSPAAHLGRSLCLWDTKAGADVSPREVPQGPVNALAVSPDGRTLASGGPDGSVRLRAPDTGKLTRCLGTGTQEVVAAAYSSDGKYLVAHLLNAPVAVWEAHTGKAVPLPADLGDRSFALAPRGGLIATAPPGFGNGPISLYDFPSFKLRRRLELPAAMTTVSLAFSPDGAVLAASDAQNSPGTFVLWETATGRRRLVLEEVGGHVGFSPDGRTLATWSWRGPAQLRETATGRVLRCLEPVEKDSVFALAFSPDGSMAAMGCGSYMTTPGLNAIRVWETATGRERCRLLGHTGAVKALMFFPDGRRLASGSEDGTALVWDLHRTALGGQPGKPLSTEELEAAWEKLAARDAAVSYRALCRLACDPERAVPLLEKHRRRQGGGPNLGQLIRALDSDEYEEREKASRELARRGRDAEPALREALADKPSPEARRRINALVRKLEEDPGGTYLRWRRAVELLEQVGTPQAVGVLRRLAEGDAASGLVREAKAALERLHQRRRP